MEPTDLTIEILRSIRDEVRGVRAEVRATNDRVDALRDQVGALREQQVHAEVRLATELVASTAEFRGLRDDLRRNGFVRERLDDHETRIEALEKRTG